MISEKIDINFTDTKEKRNALHVFYFNALKPSKEYLQEITKVLAEAGVNVNGQDRYRAIPLKYAITITKLTTDQMQETYRYLLKCGSNYLHQDIFGKSCLDYAKELSWRSGVEEIIREYENEY